MSSGKKIRISRLFHAESGRSIIIPMDHGASVGPMPGLANMLASVRLLRCVQDLVQGLILHRGTLRHIDASLPITGLPPRILHFSCSTCLDPDGKSKSIVAQIEDALQMGTDAVSIHINLGVDGESEMLRDFGRVASVCDRWGMPLLAMMYVRPKGINSTKTSDIKLAARVAAEIGADMVKVSYPGSVEAMREVTEGCFIPVLVAGGELANSPNAVIETAAGAIQGGAAGLCIGRNVFQAKRPAEVISALAQLVHPTVHLPTAARFDQPAITQATA